VEEVLELIEQVEEVLEDGEHLQEQPLDLIMQDQDL
jgi:hypothetical protein